MRKKQVLLSFLITFAVMSAAAGIFAFAYASRQAKNIPAAEESAPVSSAVSSAAVPSEEVSSALPELREVKLLMAGDNLLHLPVVNSGWQPDGSYNFDHLFANLKDDIQSADIAVINQETVLGGTEIGLSEYPQFNSPQEVGDAIAAAGFDVVMHANNHVMDRGFDAIERTMRFWKKYPNITVVGVNENEDEYNNIKTVEVNGLTLAILSYTDSTNGIPVPQDKPWLVNMTDEEKIAADIARAKETADFIIALPHWGIEYSYTPSENQELYARFMANLGVDLIIGTHPHVLEPIEWIDRKDGGRTLVYYSLGNFVSNQNESPRMLGGIAEVTIVKAGDEPAYIETAAIEPVVTHFEAGDLNYGVYKLSQYTDELAARHRLRTAGSYYSDSGHLFGVNWLRKLCEQVLGEWYTGEPSLD
ncbi:MAG: CapA family protein [Oscillospiraceae bacterium]|jgi:poly-gamma-glutamate synthesis protein (capsule biosynthesis protein)|nr:CapA family protein [Oscillospiraceae bacterium]